MPFERLLELSGSSIPQTNDTVSTPTSQRAIRAKRDAPDDRRMSFERVQRLDQGLFGSDIPQTDDAVRTSTGEYVAIWTERNAPDVIRMPFERLLELSGSENAQTNEYRLRSH